MDASSISVSKKLSEGPVDCIGDLSFLQKNRISISFLIIEEILLFERIEHTGLP